MAGERDNDVGFDTIKDSLGMTDDDFKPTTGDDDLDLGDDDGQEEADDDAQQQTAHDDGDVSDDDPPPQRTQDRQERPEPRQQEKPKKDDLRRSEPLAFNPRALPKMDAKGNVIDPRTGQILARAGSEARIFNRVHKQAMDYVRTAGGHFQNRLSETNTRLNRAVEIGLELEQQLQQARESQAAIQAFELTQDELVQAAGLAKRAKTDPLGTIKYLLTEASVRGIDLQQLGLQPGSIDPKSLNEIIQQNIARATKPIEQMTQEQKRLQTAQQEEQRYRDQAEEMAVTFFNKNQAAKQYMPIFKRVYEKPENQHMSLDEVWAKLQLHLMRRGIDPMKGPSNRQRRELQQEDTRPQRRSLPNGRSMTPVGNDRQQQDNGPAPVSQSYDDIIRDVLKRKPLNRAV